MAGIGRGSRIVFPVTVGGLGRDNHRTVYREGTVVRTWRERDTEYARIREDSDRYARGRGYVTRPVAVLASADTPLGQQRLAEGTWNDRYTEWERAGKPGHPWRPLVPGATACWQCGHQKESVYHQGGSPHRHGADCHPCRCKFPGLSARPANHMEAEHMALLRRNRPIKRAGDVGPLRLDDGPGSPDRFTLDEERAAGWIARAVAQSSAGPMDGEDGYDRDLPAISAGWRPWHDDGSATSDLLSLAQAAGIVTGPPEAAIDYEQITDQDGSGYRWLVYLGDEAARLILADAFSDSWAEDAGAEAALAILRDAVIAGNELLADLDRYMGAVTRPAPPAEVWVLEYSHKHGTDLTGHTTEQAARLAAADIARAFWHDIPGLGAAADPNTLDDGEVTRVYFEECADQESYDINRLYVTGKAGPGGALLRGRAGNMPDRQRTILPLASTPGDRLRADLDAFAASLPCGEWGATELGLLANFLADHGYDID